MWTQQILWRTDGHGKLLAEANGYTVTVEWGVGSYEIRFVVWGGHGAVYPVTWGIRSTALEAMESAEQVIAGMPANRREHGAADAAERVV